MSKEQNNIVIMAAYPASELAAFLGTLHTFIDLGYPVVGFECHQVDRAESNQSSKR